jgi:hypothetical protein
MKMYSGVAISPPRHMREPNQDPTSLEMCPPEGDSSDCSTGNMGAVQPTTVPLLKAAMFTAEGNKNIKRNMRLEFLAVLSLGYDAVEFGGYCVARKEVLANSGGGGGWQASKSPRFVRR